MYINLHTSFYSSFFSSSMGITSFHSKICEVYLSCVNSTFNFLDLPYKAGIYSSCSLISLANTSVHPCYFKWCEFPFLLLMMRLWSCGLFHFHVFMKNGNPPSVLLWRVLGTGSLVWVGCCSVGLTVGHTEVTCSGSSMGLLLLLLDAIRSCSTDL